MAGSDASMRMADRLTGGRLFDILSEGRKLRAPWTGIATALRTDYGVEVTADTLRNWGRKLGVPELDEAEAAS